MLATTAPLPLEDGWAYEVKWDGVRALVAVDGGRLTITSRNGNDVTASYPELQRLGLQLGSRQVLLDGEIVAFNADGKPDFGALQARMHVRHRAQRSSRSAPVQLLLFDLLHLQDRSLLDLPYDDRRALLEGLALEGAAGRSAGVCRRRAGAARRNARAGARGDRRQAPRQPVPAGTA